MKFGFADGSQTQTFNRYFLNFFFMLRFPSHPRTNIFFSKPNPTHLDTTPGISWYFRRVTLTYRDSVDPNLDRDREGRRVDRSGSHNPGTTMRIDRLFSFGKTAVHVKRKKNGSENKAANKAMTK